MILVLAMDALGNFIVTWESFRDNDVGGSVSAGGSEADSYGIYFQAFLADGTSASGGYQANLTITSDPIAGQPAVPDPTSCTS